MCTLNTRKFQCFKSDPKIKFNKVLTKEIQNNRFSSFHSMTFKFKKSTFYKNSIISFKAVKTINLTKKTIQACCIEIVRSNWRYGFSLLTINIS